MCRRTGGDASWGGRVLLLESEDDTGFEPEEQAALRSLHPRAAVHVFPGAGHLSWLEQPDAFAAEVSTLLAPSAWKVPPVA